MAALRVHVEITWLSLLEANRSVSLVTGTSTAKTGIATTSATARGGLLFELGPLVGGVIL